MKAVADTSALLSLEYMGVLDDLMNIADIYTTESVNEELKEITGFRDEKSGIAKKILLHVSDGKIKCIDAKGDIHSKNIPLNHCLALCLSAKIPVLLTEDADAAYYLGKMAAQKGIKLRTSTAVLVELIRSGKINAQSARKKLDELMKKRSWEGGIIEMLARRYME
ncbi:MAG: hypothetical protein Q7J35_04620 [Candidatus Methanoperedens sp.]|nr:hypothetical protein [Candidatus Methanoperedens sp.]